MEGKGEDRSQPQAPAVSRRERRSSEDAAETLSLLGLNVRGDVFNRADALGSREYDKDNEDNDNDGGVDDNDNEEEGGRCVAEFSFSSHYLRIALPRCTATRNF